MNAAKLLASSLFQRSAFSSLNSVFCNGFKTLSVSRCDLFRECCNNAQLITGDSLQLPASLIQIRHGFKRRRIMGGGRPPIPLKVMPRQHDFNWQPIYPKDGEYTVNKLKIRKLGGRDPETGKVVVRTLGGGNKKYLKWVDYTRWAPEGETIEEKVFKVVYSPLHTALVALVAREGHKRWIIASENMKPGDIIKTINVIPRNPIPGEEGNAYPVGALLPGTLVHNIEKVPNQPGLRPELGETRFCINAGTHATILRRWKDSVVIKLPNGGELTVSPKCMAVVGKVSNVNHYTVNYLVPQRMRWKGIRPRSGLWHKKDGYCGRKLRKPKPLNFLEGLPEKPALETHPIHLFAE